MLNVRKTWCPKNSHENIFENILACSSSLARQKEYQGIWRWCFVILITIVLLDYSVANA